MFCGSLPPAFVAELSANIYGSVLPSTDDFRYGRGVSHLLGYARVSTRMRRSKLMR